MEFMRNKQKLIQSAKSKGLSLDEYLFNKYNDFALRSTLAAIMYRIIINILIIIHKMITSNLNRLYTLGSKISYISWKL